MNIKQDKLSTVYGRHIIMEKLRETPIIVDAGACKGGFVKRWGRLSKEMNYTIFVIECDRDNINVLKQRNLPHMVLCAKALVGREPKNKPTYFHYKEMSASGSVGYMKDYIVNHRNFKGLVKYKVDALPINKIFSEFKIDKIDYMKMNIEGSERDVLRAMTARTASRIDQISVLIHTNVLSGITPDAITARLHELGFIAWSVRRKEIFGFREDL